MIARLTGKPEISQDSVIIDVNGVGYGVTVSQKTKANIGSQKEVTLLTYLHVTETALELYGFEHQAEMKLFKLLLAVSGVGPRIAIAITNEGAQSITEAVQNAQVSFFTQFPRVGKKLAQKIIIDLTSKLGSLKELDLGPVSDTSQAVIDALISLGFSEMETQSVLQTIDTSEMDVAQAIKLVLKQMGSK